MCAAEVLGRELRNKTWRAVVDQGWEDENSGQQRRNQDRGQQRSDVQLSARVCVCVTYKYVYVYVSASVTGQMSITCQH